MLYKKVRREISERGTIRSFNEDVRVLWWRRSHVAFLIASGGMLAALIMVTVARM